LIARIGSVKATVTSTSAASSGGSSSPISFTTPVYPASGNSLSMTTTGGSPSLWLCGDSESNPQQDIRINANYIVQETDYQDYVSVVGYTNTNSCADSDPNPSGDDFAGAMVGVINSASATLQFHGGYHYSSPSLTFTTGTITNTVIIVMCGLDSCTDNGGSVTITPSTSGCVSHLQTTADQGASASIYICSSMPPNTYTVAPVQAGDVETDWAAGAWVFSS
jgi:hypothetical protein